MVRSQIETMGVHLGRQERARWLNASARERAPLLPRATVAMAFALAAAVWLTFFWCG